MRRALVVGLGAVDRGDDAIGPVVVGQVRELLEAGAPSEVAAPEIVVHEDPTALVELMAGRPLAVVVDALRSPGRAGSVHVIEAGQSPLPAATDPGPAGSHGFGLASALELARALGTLPPEVVVVGVVGTSFAMGAPLSEPVARAAPVAAAAVLAALGPSSVGSSQQQPAEARSPRPRSSDVPRVAAGIVRSLRDVGDEGPEEPTPSASTDASGVGDAEARSATRGEVGHVH